MTEPLSPGAGAPPSRQPDAPSPGPSGDARPGPRLGIRTRLSVRVLLVTVLAPLVFLLAAPLLLVGQEITAPSWVRDRVEAAAASALGGGALRFEAITVRVPADLHPEVRLLGATLRDRAGRLVAHVPSVAMQVSPRGLLFEHRLLVQEIDLDGAELSLSRARDGRVDLAFGTPGPRPPVGRAEGLASLPDQFERLFERPALSALRQVRVEGLVVNYQDERVGRTWTVDGGSLGLDLSGGMTRLSGEVSVLSGRSYVTRARIDYESPRGSPAADINVIVTDVAAADVASQSPALTWLRVVDAPISMALRASLDEQGALGPTSVALKIAQGELRPHPSLEPVRFDVARAYLSYDPLAQAVRFDRVEVRSDWGGVLGSGRADLREIQAGLPRALLGQFTLRDVTLNPPGLYDAPAHLPEATAQFRLRLDPFTVDVAQASLALPGEEGSRLDLSGQVAGSEEGWRVALDAHLGEIARDRIMALWPERFRPGLRAWLDTNLTTGTLRNLAAALRIVPGDAPGIAVTADFAGLDVKPLWTHPPITGGSGRMTWEDGVFTAALDRGQVEAPEGGPIEIGGTAIAIHPPGPDGRSPATVDLSARGPVTAALSLLDQPPWRFLSSAGLPVRLADGRAEATGTIDLFLGTMQPGELRYDVAATLRDVSTDLLIPGFTLGSDAVTATVTPAGLEIAGPATVGSARVEGSWRQGFAPEDKGRSQVRAQVEINPRVLDEFGILLPEGSVSGEGQGDLTVDFASGKAPAFSLRSGLGGLALSVPEIGWSKGAGRSGELLVEGSLGSPVKVDRIDVTAPGLSAEGDLRLTGAGAFDRLRISRLKVGDWLDAPVTLTARPGSDTPAVEVSGGTLDLAAAAFGSGGSGDGGPVKVALDRLQVTEDVALTDFAGDFSTTAGLEGRFSGFVNGGPPVTGRVAPQGDRVAARIQGEDAGAVMKAANLFTRAEGGALDLLILPVDEASYSGELWITDLKVRDAPVLASLLNAASVIGLLQQLGGQGILFDEVSADFRIDPTAVTVNRASAMGAGLGISMAGVFDTENYLMSFQGVLSPLYLLNGIGSILTRPGEGLLGFNFTLNGDPDAPAVGVNPLSVLAPGALRDLLRRHRGVPRLPPAVAPEEPAR
ncbi:DUF3971 domain-containing protein [Rubellimicrobium mesophilum]|uniref:DUF3971 domain-containing protein n=1 Tax=Rubellimicrobium mesophilum TaxID=1123067 RepID=UPI0012E30FF8|nr:DUF3971 domain-containing protein [Rubellimicrobium mesophilum]